MKVDEIDGVSRVRARVLGREIAFDLGAPGLHMAENALGALLAAGALGADLDACAAALEAILAAEGPGRALLGCDARRSGDHHRRKLQRQSRLDAGGAGPARRGEAGAKRASHRDHRRHARAWSEAEAMHAELAADLSANKVDLLFGAGPLTRALFDAAPASMRAALGASSRTN